MLQLTSDNRLVEQYSQASLTSGMQASLSQFGNSNIYDNGCGGSGIGNVSIQPYYQTYWFGYPVYVCQDKTKKAIEILKTLQAEKLLECKSVNKFIELVEKISKIL